MPHDPAGEGPPRTSTRDDAEHRAARERESHHRIFAEHTRESAELRTNVALAGRFFSTVTLRFFNLTTLAAVPVRTTPLFPIASAMLAAIDRLLLHPRPPLHWQAWLGVVECTAGGRSSSNFSRVH